MSVTRPFVTIRGVFFYFEITLMAMIEGFLRDIDEFSVCFANSVL
jgi:hypothetical protein